MIIKQVIVAGHICLDLRPDLSKVPEGQFEALLQPGKLIEVDGMALSAGGVVSNTGLALHQLGVPVRLIGKIGQDPFGSLLKSLLVKHGQQLAADLVEDLSAATSFSIILNPPGLDRMFLHDPGANDTFYASDLPRATLGQADLFHFGYPSLMRSVYRGGGGELVSILQKARREGLTTSLDFSLPDLSSPAAGVDWPEVLANSLPLVDLFVPSVEELFFLLDRETFNRLSGTDGPAFQDAVTPSLLHDLSEIVLGYGVKALLVKLGHRGIYLRTAGSQSWAKGGRGLEGLGTDWHGRELWTPAFKATVRGTTGAGDAAIAGFLSAIAQNSDPVTALEMAAAAGACWVERTDAEAGIMDWEETLARIAQGWENLPLDLSNAGWRKDAESGIWEAEEQ